MQLTYRGFGFLLMTAPLLALTFYAASFLWLALIWFVFVSALLLADWRLTPRADAWLLARTHDDRLSLATQNSIRIKAFWQIDLRVERSFALGEVARLVLFADVQNITNRENAEEIVYSASFRQRSTITSLPTIAVVGGRLEF